MVVLKIFEFGAHFIRKLQYSHCRTTCSTVQINRAYN